MGREAKLSDFADYMWVLKRISDYGVKPTLFTSKTGINQYRQKEQALTNVSLDWISDDFDLIFFPFGLDLPAEEREEFTSELHLLSWLRGKYIQPSKVGYAKEKIIASATPYKPLSKWLTERGIDVNKKKRVRMRLLVNRLEPAVIPKTVKAAHDLGIEVRKYNKRGDKQPRGCAIDVKGKNPRVYHVFRDFKPGEVEINEIIPGLPQITAKEGKIWWGLASDNREYVKFYHNLYEDEFNPSPTYEQILEKREPIEDIHEGIKKIKNSLGQIKLL